MSWKQYAHLWIAYFSFGDASNSGTYCRSMNIWTVRTSNELQQALFFLNEPLFYNTYNTSSVLPESFLKSGADGTGWGYPLPASTLFAAINIYRAGDAEIKTHQGKAPKMIESWMRSHCRILKYFHKLRTCSVYEIISVIWSYRNIIDTRLGGGTMAIVCPTTLYLCINRGMQTTWLRIYSWTTI